MDSPPNWRWMVPLPDFDTRGQSLIHDVAALILFTGYAASDLTSPRYIRI